LVSAVAGVESFVPIFIAQSDSWVKALLKQRHSAMPDLSCLEINHDGTVVTRPVLGWTTVTVAETAVLLSLQYAEKPEDIRTGGKSLQVVMTPQNALELAESLTKQARRILDAPSPPQRAQH
jgi:hypothetical protein